MLTEIRFIELTEPSDTLKYTPFFNHFILQTIYTYFYSRILHFSDSVWGGIWCYSIEGSVFFLRL